MSIFDAGDYINTLVTLSTGTADQKRVSLHTLYRSLGLEMEDEIRKMRKENVQNAIQKKEIAALDAMDLNSLRALDDEDEVPEPKTPAGAAPGGEAPLPGEVPGGAPGGLPDLGLPGGAPPPPLPTGGPPPAPPPPPAGGPPGGAPAGGPPPGP